MDLPLSRLHVLETGRGEPLIMVPATISELENWRTLAQFMGQWFHVYFFELPGHGQSSPFPGKFSSARVAELVEQMADHLGLARFNLMGFSFGGILAMRTYERLAHRIDRLILIAPCLGRATLPFSETRLSILSGMNHLLGNPAIQAGFNGIIHNPRTVAAAVRTLKQVGKLESTLALEDKLLHMPPTTLSVLNCQLDEILTTRFEAQRRKYQTPCYFAMSIHDPLLKFDSALATVQAHFENVQAVRLTFPYHQPPKPFTYEELNQDFFATVDDFMRVHPATPSNRPVRPERIRQPVAPAHLNPAMQYA
jgi:pimeloyl-ACP methyl ester carboxylesterase